MSSGFVSSLSTNWKHTQYTGTCRNKQAIWGFNTTLWQYNETWILEIRDFFAAVGYIKLNIILPNKQFEDVTSGSGDDIYLCFLTFQRLSQFEFYIFTIRTIFKALISKYRRWFDTRQKNYLPGNLSMFFFSKFNQH